MKFVDHGLTPADYRYKFLHYLDVMAPEVLESLKSICPLYDKGFPLPPLAEQERIVAKLEKLMKFCDELEAKLKQGITNTNRLLQTARKVDPCTEKYQVANTQGANSS